MDVNREDIEVFIQNNNGFTKDEIKENLFSIYEISNSCEDYVINKLIDHIYEQYIEKNEKYERRKKQLEVLKS